MDSFRNPNPRGESFSDEEDSVEGHQMPRTNKGQRVTDDQDEVTGHIRLTEDEDVEGHTWKR